MGSRGGPSLSGRVGFADYYRSRLNRVLFRWIDLRKVVIARRALAGVAPDELVLDVGSGSGGIAQRLRRRGFGRLVCLDRDPELVAACRGAGLGAVRLDFDRGLPFRDRVAGGVLMADALEHAEEPRLVVAEIWRVLRPGGVAVVFTPPYDSVRWVLAERLHHLVTGRPSDHLSPLTREALQHLLGRHFSEVAIARANCNLTLAGVARRAA